MDELISFDDSNVTDTFEIKVITEALKDNYELSLNPQQINNEILNLLYDKYNHNIKNKIKDYLTLFNNNNNKNNFIFLKHTKPIISCNKLYYKDNNDDIIDTEFENNNYFKSQSIFNYLDQFNRLNRNRTDTSYIVIANKLYSLSKPFVEHTNNDYISFNTNIHSNTDAYLQNIFNDSSDNKFEHFKLIGNINIPYDLYKGDNIDIIGYFNIADESNIDNFYIIDFNQYIDHLLELKEGDSIIVKFNDFNDLQNFNGTITEINENYINFTLQSETYTYYFYKYNKFFIYQELYEYKFSKTDLLKYNIAFKLIDDKKFDKKFDKELLLSFIYPVNISELIYISEDKFQHIYNLNDFNTFILKNYNLDFNMIHNDTKQYILQIINKQLPKKISNNIKSIEQKYIFNNKNILLNFEKNKINNYYYYNDFNTFADNELNRTAFFKKQKDFGFTYLLELFIKNFKQISDSQKFIELRKTIINNIEKISQLKDTFNVSCDKKYTIAKSYATLQDLNNDNDIDIYFDEKLDKTKYQIKQKFINQKGNIKNLIIKELINEFNNIPQTELEFEATSIIQGKRLVRQGDHAILEDNESSIIFSRQIIQDKALWIKVGKVPFKLCSSNLESFQDTIKDNSCILDSFDNICKSFEIVKINNKYNKLISQIELIDDILYNFSEYDNIILKFQAFTKKFKQLLANQSVRSIAFNSFTYHNHIDYKEYNDIADINTLIMDLDFNEKNQYAQLDQEKIKDDNINLPNYDILKGLLEFTQIEFDETIVKYILDYNEINNGEIIVNLTDKINEEKIRLLSNKAVNKKLYQTEIKYKKAIDDAIDIKIKKFTDDINYNYNKSSIITITSMLILIILIFYPNKLIGKILPSCIQFLAYNIKDDTKSLTKYFACLLKTIGRLNELTVDNIEKLIKDEINTILVNKYDIKTKLEENKDNIENNTILLINKNYQEFFMFKPHLSNNINIHTSHKLNQKKILEQMKQMLDKVKHEKVLNKNIFNFPTMVNSCCLEQISTDLNYYKFFENIKPITKNNQTQFTSKIDALTLKQYIVTENIDPFLINTINVPFANKINNDKLDLQKNTFQIQLQLYLEQDFNDQLLEDIIDNFDSDDWWNMIFYPKLHSKSKYIIDILPKYISTYSKEFMEYIEKTIVLLSNLNNATDTRNTLLNFIKSTLPIHIHRLFNLYKPKDFDETKAKTDKFFILIESISNNTKILNLKPKINELLNKYIKNIHLLFIDSVNNNNIIIKNISILAYLLFDLLNQFITLAGKDTDNIKVLCNIVNYIISLLVNKLINNDSNIELLKKSIEELREKRKQDLMDLYDLSDEERALQMLLKKIGITAWNDTGSNQDQQKDKTIKQDTPLDIDISKIKNQQEEDENYELKGYQGENDDGDDNDDEYGLKYDDQNQE
jgi:hypothetical protein